MSTATHTNDAALLSLDIAHTSPAEPRRSAFIDIEQIASALVIRPQGPTLGERECQLSLGEVERAVRERIRGTRSLVLDLSNVTSMRAVGLGFCQSVAHAAQGAKLKPVLCGARREFLDFLRMFRADCLFTIVTSQGELLETTGL